MSEEAEGQDPSTVNAASRGPGRPEWQPTPEQKKTVEAMAGYGIPQEDIALVLDIDPKTLRAHCRDELDKGMIKANVGPAETLHKAATFKPKEGEAYPQSTITAAIFWTKTRLGWKETSVQEHRFSHEDALNRLDDAPGDGNSQT